MRAAITYRTAQGSVDVLIEADPSATLDEIFGRGQPVRELYVDGRAMPGSASIASAGLRDGVVVSVQPPHQAVPVAEAGSPALLVTSGPAAGASVTVPEQGLTVGRATPLPLGDNEVSGRHLQVRVDGDSVLVADAGSANGTYVAGRPVRDERRVRPGELIWVGRTALAVATAPEADAALAAREPGQLRYSRSPRLANPPQSHPIRFPEPPPPPAKTSFPLLAVIAPVVIGLLMAVVLKQWQYLAFIALSPVMLIGNTISGRRSGKRGHRQQLAEFERAQDRARDRVTAAQQAELAYLRQVHPDPATLLLIVSAPSARIWERQPADPDFLALRVGTATQPWQPPEQSSERTGPGQPDQEHGRLWDAPVAVSLPERGAVGLVGSPQRTRAVARGMLLSLGVLHSPRDVTVTVLTDSGSAPDWEWLRWLPHSRQPDNGDGLLRLGNDDGSIAMRLAELNAALEERRPSTGMGRRPVQPESVDVVVLDGSYRLRLGAGLGALLRDGPAAGIYFLCLDETMAQLPPECRQAIVQLTDDEGSVTARVLELGRESAGVVADAVSPAVCTATARALAPVQESGGRDRRDSLPASLRFLDAARLDAPEPGRIRSDWARGGRTTRALLGARAEGPFVLDLAQGPHLLVAGTTGSGKSELLQTLVASLAAANRPDAMNFVLVDYKGGAAFSAFEGLPHAVGTLTDLDEFLVDRALTSLRAELQRRKAILGQAGKPNVSEYWNALPVMPGADPLPRLVIVVDEFAVMADKLPDQLRSLVDIGAQGRSLGIHLVLATQRPAGVVSADLRANINLRIALRVASPDDSRDVIETVDAARIPADGAAGRAFAWLGGGRPVEFQTARVGGLRPGAQASQLPTRVTPLRWADLGYPRAKADETAPGPHDPTDLSALVLALREAADQERVGPQHSPWQPPLPELIDLGWLAPAMRSRSLAPGPEALPLVFGLADHPQRQSQTPATFDVARSGHLLIAGAPQSGRTTLLRALAGSLAGQVSAEDVHLYVIDGGGALAALSALPHCGAVVTLAEPDRIDRLLSRLSNELSQRSRSLSASGYSDLAEYRASGAAGQLGDRGQKPPYLLVLVDRYDAFVAAVEHVDGGRLVGQLQRLVRDGLAAGIRVVATGDRSLLTGRLASQAENKIVLRMADPADYTLAGVSPRAVPRRMPNGRGLGLPGGDLLQVAVLAGEPQGTAQNHALRDLAERIVEPQNPPMRVDAVPMAVTYDQARRLPEIGEGALVGVGGDELAQVRVDAPSFLVIGHPGTGRSTALAVQARSLADYGLPLALITPRKSTLAEALDPGTIRVHLTSTDAEAARALAAALADGPVAIVADDADLLVDTPLAEELMSRYRAIRDSGHRMLAATTADGATVFRGLVPELAKRKCGLVLEPGSVADGGPFQARLPASVLASGMRLRGALIRGAVITPVQVPTLASSPRLAPAEAAGMAVPGVEEKREPTAW
jgi:S-DNA-T family DNA segregation ATPase FtsK/SpoIIIE